MSFSELGYFENDRVKPSFIRFHLVFLGFYRVLPGFTWFYWVSSSDHYFIEFQSMSLLLFLVQLNIIGFFFTDDALFLDVACSVTGFHEVFTAFTGFSSTSASDVRRPEPGSRWLTKKNNINDLFIIFLCWALVWFSSGSTRKQRPH